ncbi:hypothetical protein BDAP_000549 [Binucleata daphniae]
MILLYVSIVKAFSIVLSESSPCSGSIKIVSKQDEPSFLVVTFPKIVFPHLRKFGNIIKMKTNKQNQIVVIFYFTKDFDITLYYDKLILPISEYEWKAERGFYFPCAYLILGSSVIKSIPVFDIYYVPDFTVPFLAYNTCGCIFSFLFGLVIKQRVRKTKQ